MQSCNIYNQLLTSESNLIWVHIHLQLDKVMNPVRIRLGNDTWSKYDVWSLDKLTIIINWMASQALWKWQLIQETSILVRQFQDIWFQFYMIILVWILKIWSFCQPQSSRWIYKKRNEKSERQVQYFGIVTASWFGFIAWW